jgi:hypothetical protein
MNVPERSRRCTARTLHCYAPAEQPSATLLRSRRIFGSLSDLFFETAGEVRVSRLIIALISAKLTTPETLAWMADFSGLQV